MARKTISPIMTWIFWGILVLGVFIVVMREYFIDGFAKDTSNISYLIVLFFLYGFFASLKVAIYLQMEYRALKRMQTNQRICDTNASDAAALFDAAMERIRHGDRIDLRSLISTYGAKLKTKVDNISVISGMLVTIGLLGTVLGLIITINGLGDVLSSGATDYVAMKVGLNETVSGMGTAFFTTLVGALLGGVVLKVLGAEMRRSATHLVANTLHFSELYLAPQGAQSASEALVALEKRVTGLGQNLDALGSSFASVIDTIDSKQTALAEGLGDLVGTVNEAVEVSNLQANERVGALVASVDGAIRQSDERTAALVAMIEEATRLADERLGLISSSVEQTVIHTNRQADERIEALVTVSKTTLEETSRTVDERLAVLMEGIGQMVGETHRIADERTQTLAQAIEKTTEETHRLADERLNALLGTVESTANDTHREANERLVELVDQVGQSIDQSRRDAEERLGNKASALAEKLTEAATVLAALSNADSQPMDEDRA